MDGSPQSSEMEIPALPTTLTLEKVYRDFFNYLYTCTRGFFEENTVDGLAAWNRTQDNIHLILTIPNGWDTSQQIFLRGVATNSGWVKKEDAGSRVTFVTESEASVHYTLKHQNSNWLANGMHFAVIDAGGSTVDSILYQCTSTSPKLVLKEACASTCIQAGGIYVDRAISKLIKKKLKQSWYARTGFVKRMIAKFEKKPKRLFDGSQAENRIEFGYEEDNDHSNGVFKGKISLSNDDMAHAFNEVIPHIEDNCQKLLRGRDVKHIVLVGGFGDSPYLRKRLEKKFGKRIVTANEPLKKAAAEGAALWYLKRLVTARAARYTFGVTVIVPFQASDNAHKARIHDRVTNSAGEEKIDNAFSLLVARNTVLEENHVTVNNYYRQYNKKPTQLHEISVVIHVWEGEGIPDWYKDEKGNILKEMRTFCTIRADLSPLYTFLQTKVGKGGQEYWQVDYQICVEFGGTELKAMLQWKEGDKVCQGPATILGSSTIEGVA